MPKLIKINGQLEGEGSYARDIRTLLRSMPVGLSDNNFDTLLNYTTPAYYNTSGANDVAICGFEGTVAPESWQTAARLQDKLFTFSEHNKVAFRCPMSVLSPFVDLDEFTLGPVSEDNGKKQFLFVGQADERKGLDVLLEAWELGDFGSKAKLLVHSYKVEHGDTAPKVTHNKFKTNDKSITQTRKLLTDAEIVSLFQRSDCYVSPNRAEGWQSTSLQALSCGCNVIVTNEPSVKPIRKRKGVFTIKSSNVPPDRNWCDRNLDGWIFFEWFEPDIENLVDVMTSFLDDPIPKVTCRRSAMNYDVSRTAMELYNML